MLKFQIVMCIGLCVIFAKCYCIGGHSLGALMYLKIKTLLNIVPDAKIQQGYKGGNEISDEKLCKIMLLIEFLLLSLYCAV